MPLLQKGCDVKTINVLIQENQFKRDDIVILGVSCDGVVDKDVKLADTDLTDDKKSIKCITCDVKTPGDFDHLLGEGIESTCDPMKGGIFDEVERIRSLSREEKWQFWMDHFRTMH